ncbi:F-box/kelch-repeat protein At3g06240-like [Papaver somniferum]|uniref:F-box/kelch-repeat protein At3g06240-like n=1 Tax=Papaver somniferum TaxID=3469 RepID=UPI000E6F9841|nr:F-box/kelch-repeat protein At3g06240-like [Papaver somniferum]
MNINIDAIRHSHTDFEQWIIGWLHSAVSNISALCLSNESLICRFMCIIWYIWKDRCSEVFQDQKPHLQIKNWRPPDKEFVKINIDGPYISHTKQGSVGLILRNFAGTCLGAKGTPPFGRRPKIYVLRKPSESSFLFAYDCKIDDYKLVRVERFDPSCRPVKLSFEVEVYTLGTGSWRKIGNVSYMVGNHELGVLVNGAHHWFVVSLEKMLIVLVSFDISNERFVEVSLPTERSTYPEEPLEDDKYGKHVAELRGRLCLVFHVFGVRVDVWVMQEYAVRDSWTKSFRITEETITEAFSLRLKWSFESNKILLQGYDKLILYDPKSERYWKLAVCQITDVVNCVTSLVSLNSSTYLK